MVLQTQAMTLLITVKRKKNLLKKKKEKLKEKLQCLYFMIKLFLPLPNAIIIPILLFHLVHQGETLIILGSCDTYCFKIVHT